MNLSQRILGVGMLIIVMYAAFSMLEDFFAPSGVMVQQTDVQPDVGASTPSPTGSQYIDLPGGGSLHVHSLRIWDVGVPQAEKTVGGELLEPTIQGGVKVFELTAQRVMWNILDDVQTVAYTFNGAIPGPQIRVTQGDRVRVIVKNELPEPTTVHWHGINVPNSMDGVPHITQAPIEPGETFIYQFIADPVGTFMYHPHINDDVQIGLGMYGSFIIDPREPEENPPDIDESLMISEWRIENGVTYASMPFVGAEPTYFTINGKAYPSTEVIEAKVGQRVRIRLYGIGQFVHPMHLHGFAFRVTAIDGMPVPEGQQQFMDTVTLSPGQRYDIEFIPDRPGQWMLHCHIPHHLTNNHAFGHGGLITMINVTA